MQDWAYTVLHVANAHVWQIQNTPELPSLCMPPFCRGVWALLLKWEFLLEEISHNSFRKSCKPNNIVTVMIIMNSNINNNNNNKKGGYRC